MLACTLPSPFDNDVGWPTGESSASFFTIPMFELNLNLNNFDNAVSDLQEGWAKK